MSTVHERAVQNAETILAATIPPEDPLDAEADRYTLAVLNAIGPARSALEVALRIERWAIKAESAQGDALVGLHESLTTAHDEIRGAVALLDNLEGEHG